MQSFPMKNAKELCDLDSNNLVNTSTLPMFFFFLLAMDFPHPIVE